MTGLDELAEQARLERAAITRSAIRERYLLPPRATQDELDARREIAAGLAIIDVVPADKPNDGLGELAEVRGWADEATA